MTMTASDSFEDRLLEQLRRVVAERPIPAAPIHPRRGRTRLALAGGAVAAAATAVAIVASSGDVTPSAYAVQPRPDGAVTVHIRSLRDADGLEHSLRAAGIPAVVDYVPAGQTGCAGAPPGSGDPPEKGSSQRVEAGGSDAPSLSTQGPGPGAGADPTTAGQGGLAGPKMSGKVSVGSDGATFTVDPGALEPGEHLYITTTTGTVSSIGMAISKGGPPAACALKAAP
jgi:hypothetical protein